MPRVSASVARSAGAGTHLQRMCQALLDRERQDVDSGCLYLCVLRQSRVEDLVQIALHNGRAHSMTGVRRASWRKLPESYPESANPSVLPMSSSMLTLPEADLPLGPATAMTGRSSAPRYSKWTAPNSPFSLAACFAASDIRKSCKILSNRPRASSPGEENISSMILADGSAVIKAGCARKRNPS